MKLTIKQEKFCQAYIRLGDKSAAYREAYNAKGMKAETVHENASRLSNDSKVAARIAELQEEVKQRNDVTIDEIVKSLADMMRFDIVTMYDDRGQLLPINKMPKEARMMILQIESDEIFTGRDRELIGYSKKVRTYSKMDAIEKLMKHLGGYEKDNAQSKPQQTVILNLGEGEPENE